MAVYLLERVSRLETGRGDIITSVGEDAVGYEEPYAVVVRAYSATLARRLATQETKRDWTDASKSKIKQILSTGPDKVILVATTGA